MNYFSNIFVTTALKEEVSPLPDIYLKLALKVFCAVFCSILWLHCDDLDVQFATTVIVEVSAFAF